MQIHELNDFSGSLNGSAYVAVDNGSDTGKASIPEILQAATDGIDAANARIDNIIAGEAPSAAEVVDARQGIDSVTYPSLGGAIRGQVSYLNQEIEEAFLFADSIVALPPLEDGYISTTGTVAGTGGAARHTVHIITANDIGQLYKVTASRWFSMYPYIFVGTDGTIDVADAPGSGLVQYTDLEFRPNRPGNLYINHHTDNVYGLKVNLINQLDPGMISIDDLLYVSSYKPMTFTTEIGKYVSAADGTFEDISADPQAASAVVTEYIPIVGGDTYLISTDHFWSKGMYVFYDEDKNYISGFAANPGGTITEIRLKKVVAPPGAAYLIVAQWTQGHDPSIYIAENVKQSISPSARWSGYKWVCVGDSLTQRTEKADRNYYDYVSEATGINLVIMGAGGTGYARGADSNNAFYQRVANIPNDADVITLFGSFNDLGASIPLGTADDSTTSTIGGCINTTLDNIVSIIPTANIGIVAPCPWGTTRPGSSTGAYDYVELLKAIAEKWSIPFLDLWRHSGMRPWDSDFADIAYAPNDTVHPNGYGHGILAPKFKSFLETLLI